jgi:hypothetical protein
VDKLWRSIEGRSRKKKAVTIACHDLVVNLIYPRALIRKSPVGWRGTLSLVRTLPCRRHTVPNHHHLFVIGKARLDWLTESQVPPAFRTLTAMM